MERPAPRVAHARAKEGINYTQAYKTKSYETRSFFQLYETRLIAFFSSENWTGGLPYILETLRKS